MPSFKKIKTNFTKLMKRWMLFFFQGWFFHFFFITSLFLALFLPGLFGNKTLVLGGSTSVFALFDQVSDLAKRQKLHYVYNSMGSFAAIRQVERGSFSVGFMSKEPPADLSTKIKTFKLADDQIIVVYHLPLNCQKQVRLSFSEQPEKLKKIFQLSSEQADWKNLKFAGLDDKCNGKLFRINRENGSGTRSVFESKTQLNDYFYESQMKSSGAVLSQIENTPGSISYVSRSYKDKVDSLAKVQIADGTNFLKRPFYGLFLNEKRASLVEFFAFLKSDTFKKRVEELGFKYEYSYESE